MRHRVVRVRFTTNGPTYSYRCPKAKIGDQIRIDQHTTARVVGYGRRGYLGRLKHAHIEPRRDVETCHSTTTCATRSPPHNP